jgi:hypothetical protein
MQFSESLWLIQTSTERSWEFFQVDKWDKMLTLDFAQNFLVEIETVFVFGGGNSG